MTKIQIDDSKSKNLAKKTASKKSVRKITVNKASSTSKPTIATTKPATKKSPTRKITVNKSTRKKITVNKATPKKVTINKVAPKKATVNKATSKKIAVNKAKPKQIAINKSTTEKITINKPVPKQTSNRKPEPKQATVKKSTPKVIVKERKIAINPVSSSATHSNIQKSATLSRRYVHRPEPTKVIQPQKQAITIAQQPQPQPQQQPQQPQPQQQPQQPQPQQQQQSQQRPQAKVVAKPQSQLRSNIPATQSQPTIKPKSTTPTEKAAAKIAHKSADRALKSAARAAAIVDTPKESPLAQNAHLDTKFKRKHRGRRVFFALLCSAATVGALVAFVHFNMPDISVRVAAMQTGIEASYPTFVPRNYSLASVSTDKDGVIVMNFNGPDDSSFTLTEENSTWDSTALLNNYVKKNYPSDYTTIREQGITIYTRGEKASWVNGGVLYKITTSGKNLTKEQIRNIATSL